jgi:hypothetical protein
VVRRPNSRRWAINENRRTRQFHALFAGLPDDVKAAAKAAFRQFLRDPESPSLRRHELKKAHRGQHRDGSFSVSIAARYRAIYVPDGDVNVWYWIGSHADYNSFTGRK